MMSVVVFLKEPATAEIYTLSLHDALPIWTLLVQGGALSVTFAGGAVALGAVIFWRLTHRLGAPAGGG
mgnify:CR=1 FL=1